MTFVLYRTDSTRIVNTYATQAAAKAARTRAIKAGKAADTLAVADYEIYTTLIEETVERTNLMTGKKYRESVNTPNFCSPASEAYWSM